MSNLNRNLTVLLHMKEYCEQIDIMIWIIVLFSIQQ